MLPDIATRVTALNGRYRHHAAISVMEKALKDPDTGEVALVSSFGADSAVLLHMVATIDRHLPVVFIDTGKLFGETLRYRDALIERLGLTDVRSLSPLAADLARHDADGVLWYSDTEACCALRKVRPLALALDGFAAWITGRKHFQADTRAALPLFEADGARLKVNPLIGWTRVRLDQYRLDHDLPAHPLVADGYLSIGCMPCTDRVQPGEDERAGRWRGQSKTECGIHLGLTGRDNLGSGN